MSREPSPAPGRFDELGRLLAKARAAEPVALVAADPVTTATDEPEPSSEPAVPPGLLGETARYFYDSALRPVPEVALAAALAFYAGIFGRQFNTSTGAGLNLYVILLALTGVGKEGAKDSIDRMVELVRPQVPRIDEFIGPAAFASGQGLIRRLDTQPCFVSLLGEIGKTLKRLASSKATSPEKYLLQVWLDLFSRSGRSKLIRESAYSDADKNTKVVQSPCFSFLGESTPAVFFEAVDESQIEDGQIPRLLVIEYTGDRQPSNPNAGCPPNPGLVNRIATGVATALRMQQDNVFVEVPNEPTAKTVLDGFDRAVDATIVGSSSEIHRQAWNRAHLYALKLATLAAVVDAPHDAKVTREHAEWAICLVRRSVRTILRRFERGETGGSSQSKAEAAIRKKVEEFIALTPEQRAAPRYGIPQALRTGYFIPRNYFNKRLRDVQPFTGDGFPLLGKALAELVKADVLRLLEKPQAWKEFKTTGEVYTLGPNWK